MILILGMSGAGKDTYAMLLKEELEKRGFPSGGVLSYTTRPRRTASEDTHIFISTEEAALLTDRVAETTINGNLYFATRKQVQEAAYYIIDPDGLYELCRRMPDEKFDVIYIVASEKVRMIRAMSRGNGAKEAEVFQKRAQDEKERFEAFFQKVFIDHIRPQNIRTAITFVNEGGLEELKNRVSNHINALCC